MLQIWKTYVVIGLHNMLYNIKNMYLIINDLTTLKLLNYEQQSSLVQWSV